MDSVISLIAIGIFLGLVVYLKWKNPKLKIGDAINQIIIDDHVSIFVIIMILANISEALWAASINPGDGKHINMVTRFFGHLVIGILSIVNAIMSSAYIRQLVSRDPSVKNRKLSIGLLILFCLTMAYLLPIANLAVIMGGQGDFQYFTFLISHFGTAFQSMSYGSQASVALTLSHLAAMTMDIFYILAVYSREKQSVKKEGKKDEVEDKDLTDDKSTKEVKTESDESEHTRQDSSNMLENFLSKTLNFLENERSYKLYNKESKISTAAAKIRRLTAENTMYHSKVLGNLNMVVQEIDKFYSAKANLSSSDREEQIKSIEKSVKQLWALGHDLGGLGIPL